MRHMTCGMRHAECPWLYVASAQVPRLGRTRNPHPGSKPGVEEPFFPGCYSSSDDSSSTATAATKEVRVIAHITHPKPFPALADRGSDDERTPTRRDGRRRTKTSASTCTAAGQEDTALGPRCSQHPLGPGSETYRRFGPQASDCNTAATGAQMVENIVQQQQQQQQQQQHVQVSP